MKNVLLEKEKIIDKLSGRGKNVLVIGPTGVGKTHLINSIVPNILKVYLSIREGEGLATLKTTNIIISDYDKLNEEELIITGRISQINKYDRSVISECEKLFLDIIYEPVKNADRELIKTDNFENAFAVFKSSVENQIDNLKMYNDNTKISFIIKNVEGYDKILKNNILSDNIDLKKALQIFIDIYRRTKVSAKGGDIKRVFLDEITSKASLYMTKDTSYKDDKQNIDVNVVRELLDTLVDSVISIYNISADELLNDIKSMDYANAYSERKFLIVINKDNYSKNSNLLKRMFGVGNDTKGYFVDEPTIYIKKDFKNILDSGNEDTNDYYKTFIENNIEYHSMRIIDTQGLFHKNEETDRECERIIDLLSRHQCNDIIYVLSAKNDALTKKSKEVLKYLKNTCKKNININLAVTHIDEKILSKYRTVASGEFSDFDSFECNDTNNDNIVNDIINEQNSDLFEELIKDNKSGKVTIDSNISYFSYPTFVESIDTKIKGNYDYNTNVNRLLYKVAKNSKTYYIELKSDSLPILNINKMIDNILGSNQDNALMYDVSNIYYNIANNYYMLFGTPKNPALKIHHRTYEEALINWKYNAIKFTSKALGYITGYAPIETYFVEYIRAFIRESIVPKVDIDYSNVELKNQDDITLNRFKEELMNYLKNEVSRLVTISIYHETINNHYAIYDYSKDFMRILEECINRFFPSERISLVDGKNMKNKKIKELMEFYFDDKSNGLSKVLILTIIEINYAIEQFIRKYCVVRF